MCWIIINWSCPEDVAIVSNYVGMARLFDTKEEAEKYARENLNFNWKVVELEE
jgi:hypothetical protein